MIRIFDGHNDVLLRLARSGDADDGVRRFLDGDGAGHLDLPRARAGGLAGGLFAIFVPSRELEGDREEMMRQAEYDVPLPPATELTEAQGYALRLVSLLLRIVRSSEGAVRLCRGVADIRAVSGRRRWIALSEGHARGRHDRQGPGDLAMREAV